MISNVPWTKLPLQDQLCVVVYDFSKDERPFIPLTKLDLMICQQSYKNEWYRGFSIRRGPNHAGIFPADRVRKLELPNSTDQAKYVYWSIWMKILWSKFLDRFTSESPDTSKEFMEKFDKALKTIHLGQEDGLLELASDMNCKFFPYVNGLCNDWKSITFTELKELIAERTNGPKELAKNSKILALEIKSLIMGYELRQYAKGAFLVYLYDEGKDSQLSETCKIPFTTDELGRIQKLEPLLFKDLKQSSIRPTVFLSIRVLLEVPINEQKKTTTPIHKLAYWGCFNIAEEGKRVVNQSESSSNLTLIPFHSGDKVNYSSKRYSRHLHLSKQQFLTYKTSWVPKDRGNQTNIICLTNIGEILRTPPLLESKLYLKLQSGWFEKGKKKSEKNIEVLISVVNEKDEVVSNTIYEGHEKKSYYTSSVTRHCNTPQWNEMITIAMPDSLFTSCFVKCECTHVTSSEISHKTSLKWITYLPLSTQAGNVIPNSKYGMKLLPKNTYISKDLWEDDVLIKDENASKYTQRLIVQTQLDSTTLTDTAAIYRIKAWKMHSKDLKNILDDLNRTDFTKCVDHCQQIFTSVLEIIDSCVDGEIVARAMTVLFSFNKFWNTNDDFKERLLDSLARLNFVSGLLKFVSWIKLVIKDRNSVQFNQTIKSLSLLLTIMSKSFVHIKRIGIMAEAEIDRYKVVLVNLLVEIAHSEVGTNVMLCSQILKVFPESLRVLHNDGIITNNEFSFLMISLMKGSILVSLKESDTNRVSYIDHLRCIVNSDFMIKKDLQIRYFRDLTDGLNIKENYTPSDIEKMASIAVKFSEIAIDVIIQRPKFSEIIVELLQDYIKKIAMNSSSFQSLETRLTFLSLISALFDVLSASNLALSEDTFRYFNDSVMLIKEVASIQKDLGDLNPSPSNEQIDSAMLCKKLDLIAKILSYYGNKENIGLLSDLTFIATKLLAEPWPMINENNAPNFIIVSRIQSLQEELYGLVEKNLHYLCKTGQFEAALLDPIVAMGVLRFSMEWLIKFINMFLGAFPDRLHELLLSMHIHRTNLTKNDFNMFAEAPNLSKKVKKQVMLLHSITTINEKSHIFEIENVENLVSLIHFYSRHQCWAPFKETANIYQELLIKSQAFVEAAELTEYCYELMPKNMKIENEEELFTAASYYTEAGLWLRSLEVFKKLQSKYMCMNTKEAFTKLSKISEKCKELYCNLAEKPNIPFHYFLVGFYGKEVNISFQNKLFVFRGNPLESMIDFTKRIILNFPQYEQINSAKIPTSEEITQYIKAFQVIKISPINKSPRFKDTDLKFNKFSFELCSVKDKTIQNELLRMIYQRFTFEINDPLPSFRPFCELSSFQCEKISPIEMAIEQIKKKSDELLQEAQKFAVGEGNINQFQMMLNGTIDAAVNGGTAKLQETFLDGDFAERSPQFSDLCDVLKDEIDKQKLVTTECLKVHDKVCPIDLRMLHEKMVHQHENRMFQDITSTAADEASDDKNLTVATQRHALISEIARRGSKFKKNTKINRAKSVKSVFFEARKPNLPLGHDKSYTVDNTIENTALQGIIAGEFEKTYALLCTELNQDFNLHMLPRYSMGRRETMSKSSNSNTKLSNLRKSLYCKPSEKETSHHNSSSKEIDVSVVDDADEIPPALPPKFKHSDKGKQASNNQEASTKESSILAFSRAEEEACALHLSPDSASAPENDVQDEISTTIAEQSSFQTRSYTIEKSCNIVLQSKNVSDLGGEESTKVTADTIQLDLRTLASSFSLSQKDDQAKRKISKDDFDLKVRRNLSLNEMKKTQSNQT